MAEQIFDERAINAKVIFDGILNMIQGNSWSHMWYVYMLISMYFITIPLRAMITSMSVQGLKKLIYLLIIGHVLVTTLNDLTGLEIYKFMQFSVFIMYYLLGYYLCNSVIPIISIHKSAYRYVAYALLVISIIRYAAMFFSISMWGKISDFAYGGGILEFCQSVGLFVLLTGSFRDRPLKSKILYNISRCSFTIYLIHPFLINLLYKIIKVSPMNFPIVIGIGFISIVVFVASWLISNIMVKVPELNKIL